MIFAAFTHFQQGANAVSNLVRGIGAPSKLGVSFGVKVPVDQGLTSQSY